MTDWDWESIIADELRKAREAEPAAVPACRRDPSTVPGPDGDTAEDWRAWMSDRYRHRVATGHYADKTSALADTWSDACRSWHFRHSPAASPDACAGCGEVFTPSEPVERILTMLDGSYVHSDCMPSYVERTHSAASIGLIAIGLKPPTD